jgi:hypothetical protein
LIGGREAGERVSVDVLSDLLKVSNCGEGDGLWTQKPEVTVVEEEARGKGGTTMWSEEMGWIYCRLFVVNYS